jgi:hypothetical protein
MELASGMGVPPLVGTRQDYHKVLGKANRGNSRIAPTIRTG